MGVTFKVGPKSLGLYERKLGQRYREVVRLGLRVGGTQALAHVRGLSQMMVPKFTGKFSESWQGQPISWHGYRIRNTAPHGPPVDFGRRPGAAMPPLKAIEKWVAMRFGISMVQYRGRGGRFVASPARRVAFLVARSIARKGIRPRYVSDRALYGMSQRVYLALVLALDHAVRTTR